LQTAAVTSHGFIYTEVCMTDETLQNVQSLPAGSSSRRRRSKQAACLLAATSPIYTSHACAPIMHHAMHSIRLKNGSSFVFISASLGYLLCHLHGSSNTTDLPADFVWLHVSFANGYLTLHQAVNVPSRQGAVD
jgi:hypothetical protein